MNNESSVVTSTPTQQLMRLANALVRERNSEQLLDLVGCMVSQMSVCEVQGALDAYICEQQAQRKTVDVGHI